MPTWLKVFCFTWFDVPGPKDSWDGDGFQPAPLECARGFFHCLPLHIISARLGLTHVWRVPDIDIEEILRMFPFPTHPRKGFLPWWKMKLESLRSTLREKAGGIFCGWIYFSCSNWKSASNFGAQNISEECSESGWFWMMWVENYWRL